MDDTREKPEQLILRLFGQFLSAVLKFLAIIAVGAIVFGKGVFDFLYATFVRPQLDKERKMESQEPHQDEHRPI